MSPADLPPPTPPTSFPASSSPPPTAYKPPHLRRSKGGDSSLPNNGGDPYKEENVRVEENTRSPLENDQVKKPLYVEGCYPLCLVYADTTQLTLQPIPEVLEMAIAARKGLVNRQKPTPTSDGSGGSYYMFDESGDKVVAIFKPIDEEPNAVNNPRGVQNALLKRGTKGCLGALREIGAHLLDHPKRGYQDGGATYETGFSGVPLTIMVQCSNEAFHYSEGYKGGWESKKGGSLQMYVQNSGSCADFGSSLIEKFPIEEVHKIAVLDLRIGNADRHAGNILINCVDDRVTLIPIDHGYTFPHTFGDVTLEWLKWPQAKIPFSDETLDYINSLDVEKDVALLMSNGVKLVDRSIRNLRILSSLLKDGAVRGLSPYDIGRIQCRETDDEESVIEKVLAEAHKVTQDKPTEFLKTVSDLLSAELDKVSNKKKKPL